MTIPENAVRQIQSQDALFEFLRQELEWPLESAPQTYPFTAEELGLPEGVAGRVGRVSQVAPFVKGQPWGVFLVEFANDRFYRTALRQVLRGLVPSRRRQSNLPTWDVPNLLFLCVSPDYRKFTVAHFSGDHQARAKLSAFGWTPEEPVRTLCELNLPALRWPDDPRDAEGWLKQWSGAFDVEKVTDAFFKEYRRVFEQVEAMIGGVRGDRRLFTQRLFNRLLFVQFLSKKGWLRFGGSTNYLRALFDAAQSRGENFYRDRLYWAFFFGLGTLNDSREVHDLDRLRERRGEVPFLNGGLFEMADEDDVQGAVAVPNEAFGLILNDLFARFNFTVSESTPLDIEVAVDPEMLGKVFEELVTGRHETGSYYTPRPVVAFMCREALKGCLGQALTPRPPLPDSYASAAGEGETAEAIARFVDERDTSGLRRPERVLDALREVKVCDPACGSGAYLLGMLHELLDLRSALFSSHHLDAPTLYDRKLEIIQKNLYGVDIDPFAVNIARLRLWLSLAVDYEGETPKPLPNLDFKIE